jgi:hypothetical protein
MKLTFRMRVIRLALWLFHLTSFGWILRVKAFGILVHLAVGFGQARDHRRAKTLKKTVAVWREKSNSIIAELEILSSLPSDRRQQALAARSALLEEAKHLRTAASELGSARIPGAAVLTHALTRMQYKAFSRQRKPQAILRIASRVNCDTFYWDLLLWLVIPGAYSEELFGDLDEEYLLRTSTDGEASAKAWYLDQVTTTIGDFIWKKIERVAAIGTLIDLAGRWFRG